MTNPAPRDPAQWLGSQWLKEDPSREALVEAIHAHAESNGFLANMREAIALWKTLTPSLT